MATVKSIMKVRIVDRLSDLNVRLGKARVLLYPLSFTSLMKRAPQR